MKAVVFSGTTEGRRFSKKLAELGVAVTVCVATPLGAEEQGEMAGITVHAGRLQPDAMAALLAGADLCVDATHLMQWMPPGTSALQRCRRRGIPPPTACAKPLAARLCGV